VPAIWARVRTTAIGLRERHPLHNRSGGLLGQKTELALGAIQTPRPRVGMMVCHGYQGTLGCLTDSRGHRAHIRLPRAASHARLSQPKRVNAPDLHARPFWKGCS